MANQTSYASIGWESRLDTALGVGATTVNVTSTAGSPNLPCYLTIEPGSDSKREVVLATAKTSTTFTITRAQDGTSDVAHDPNVIIVSVPVSAHINDIHDRIDTHAAAADPHAGYLSQTEGDARYGQLSGATFTGNVTAPALIASGLTGATAASRYVGATASGAPTTGTFAVGDFVIDQTGKVFICTTAGTPGTWTQAGGSTTSVASDTLWDAKGDLAVATGPDAASRLALGADGQVLTADAATATGVKWAATAGSPDYVRIGESVLAATAASVTFSAIPGTYRHLVLIVDVLSSAGGNLLIRFNGDTAANYYWQAMTASGTTVSAVNGVGQTSLIGGTTLAVANRSAPMTITVPNYARTDFHKSLTSEHGRSAGNASADQVMQMFYGNWRSIAAITEITATLPSGTFSVGSVFTLYGVKGA